jgi:hypothetical protein
MPKPQIDPGALQALYANLQPGFGSTYPIQLTARTSYLAGHAALVFGSPTVLSPADDIAEFGFAEPGPGGGDVYNPPYPGASLTAWFRPLQADKEYHIDFHIDLNAPGTLSLQFFDDTETLEVDVGTGRTIGTTFYASAANVWVSTVVWYDNYWKLDHCEINQLG